MEAHELNVAVENDMKAFKKKELGILNIIYRIQKFEFH